MRSMVLASVLAGLVLQGVGAAPVEVHPAGASVPENLLRIELRFAQPQPLPFEVDRVQLLDAAGTPIRDAFLDLTLPSADARRVTLLMNPGRVKTGVAPNLALGRALHAGATVRLVVDGASTRSPPAVKDWVVTAAEPRGPRPDRWRVTAPRARTRDALVVAMGGPISASAEGLIAVSDGAGRRVPGRTALSDGDSVWRFTPDAPWLAGAQAVVVHPDLEDPAGNRRCTAFEQARASEVRCDAAVTLRFEPAAERRAPR